MMLYSAEARWFIRGPLPEDVKVWFERGFEFENCFGEDRTDKYLLFPHCDSVGVKLRADQPGDQNFEIKSIIGPSHPVKTNGVNGRTDQWVKWSVSVKESPEIAVVLTKEDQWLPVTKGRGLRKYSMDRDAPVEVSPHVGPFPVRGCNVELTRIRVEAATPDWFSLGFEAFGRVEETPGLLTSVIETFFEQQGPIPKMELTEGSSLSYPAWLAMLEWR